MRMANPSPASVAVIDHGLCNMNSIVRALEYCGGEVRIVERPKDLDCATHLVLPGVGAFPSAMAMLQRSGLADALTHRVIDLRMPVLGICLGMQLMFSVGEEIEETPGLGWIPGRVVRITAQEGERVPHIGWNTVDFRPDFRLAREVKEPKDFYFVHSFHVVPEDSETIAGTTPVAANIVSAVQTGSISGVQFHPEKSQNAGFSLLRSFLTTETAPEC